MSLILTMMGGYTKLEIEPCYIEKRQAWQSLIETQFTIQLRLADAKFEQATTLEEIQEQHAAFVQIFNTTNHWAHRDREDGAKTSVSQPQFYPTPFNFPQLELFELDESEWRRAWLRPPYVHRQIQGPLAKQLPLLGLDMLLWFFLL